MTSTILTRRHLKRRDMCELSTGEEEKPSWIAIMIFWAIEILDDYQLVYRGGEAQ